MALKSDYESYCMSLRSLVYDLDEIPKDYFKHETLLINELFYLIFEEFRTVQEALNYLKSFYDISIVKIKNKLISEGYIEDALNMDIVDEILDSYNPKKLKKILKSNGLKVPKKPQDQKELIKREIPEKIAPHELTVTEKAKTYWADNKNRADLFTDCCGDLFYYQEYYDICIDNGDKSDGENLVEFLNLHYDLAVKRCDHRGITDSLESKGYYYNVRTKEFEKGCDEILKEFILSVNPIYLSDKYYGEYEPISGSLNQNLNAIADVLARNHILKRFNELWGEFEFESLFITYDDASDYLNRLLDDENAYEKINGIIDLF
ncbi:MAG: hypothetical protein IJ287_05110 [Methanobrevibacter sp.]|nr:hypothetical protein [Methanobrevibacter sp.]